MRQKRGDHGDIVNYSIYSESEKEWVIELLEVHMIWYTALLDDLKPISAKEKLIANLKLLKEIVESGIEKRFIYFIATRKKVRFAKKRPKLHFFNGSLMVYLFIGRDKDLKKVQIPNFKATFQSELGEDFHHVDVTAETIIIYAKNGEGFCYLIHDFLKDYGVNLGLNTCIEYVGMTKNPQKRPTDGNHAGLNRVLHKSMDGDHDVFLFFNLYKVMTFAANDSTRMNFMVTNSLSNEIEVDKEGGIIEKVFISYFDSDQQLENRSRELSELKNSLSNLITENKIKSVSVRYGVDDNSEYYSFCSSRVNARCTHSFKLQLSEGELKFSKFDPSGLYGF